MQCACITAEYEICNCCRFDLAALCGCHTFIVCYVIRGEATKTSSCFCQVQAPQCFISNELHDMPMQTEWKAHPIFKMKVRKYIPSMCKQMLFSRPEFMVHAGTQHQRPLCLNSTRSPNRLSAHMSACLHALLHPHIKITKGLARVCGSLPAATPAATASAS